MSDAQTTEQDLLQMQVSLRTLLLHGGNLAGVSGITEQECEALYQFGHGFYSQARYNEAFRIFAMLVTYDHLEPRFLMALAASAQMLGRYRDALQHYSTATILLLDDPAPLLYSAECCIALRMKEGAIEALQMAIELAGDAPQHAPIRARAEALLAPMQTSAVH
ncbi:SycD/LcrH family type III secretion system chaperone [Comamonas sp. NLF-1-9]|uniref:SycD/LcrH family type III secretion system chaperone n=1 Tax=Comamonas sp. NLF-1-9 TaxID=2853163 RepID=UPI001C44BCF6|nr:SycD/LcrH family type III secretion system chaperone [Comamonas sp. NLF-1-9]QXL83619.1 SycD/LcrH family type III secretion system chaperone [Comamonas sp. NLF-1-9]